MIATIECRKGLDIHVPATLEKYSNVAGNTLSAVLETRLEKLLVRGASKLKKLLAPLKSSLSSYFEGVRGQSIKLIMLYFRFRFPQGFMWVFIG